VKVLLTGAAGFIGRAVCAQAQVAGHQVVSFDRAGDPTEDIAALDRVRAASVGCDAVVHLAAKVGLGVDLSDLDSYARDNDLGTAVVLRAAAEAGVRRLVFASSMVVYGEGAYECSRHGPVQPAPRAVADLDAGRFEPRCTSCARCLVPGLVAEDAALDPHNAYAATKVHGEHLGAVWARETGGVFAALRFHNVYGPGMPPDTPYAGVAAIFASSLRRGESPQVFEDGRQRRNFVHVDDVARAVVAALTADLPAGLLTPINIGSPWIATVGELAEQLSVALAGPAPTITGRYRLGDVRHVTADCRAAESLLGWRAEIPLATGLDVRRL
jgi:dTDP-L-rhamnose 4-epimerase